MSALIKEVFSEDTRVSLRCSICYLSYSEVIPTTFPCGHSCCLEDAKKLRTCHMCNVALPHSSQMCPNIVLKDVVMMVSRIEKQICSSESETSLKTIADNGVVTAQLELAKRYSRSCKCPQHTSLILKYFKMAADQNNFEAHAELWKLHKNDKVGSCADARSSLKYCADHSEGVEYQYEYGKHLESLNDFREALKYLKLAAEKAHSKAQYEVGLYYRDGKGGIQVDKVEAFRYFKMAADLGHCEACYKVYLRYIKGTWILNKREAIRYLKEATRECVDAQYELALKYKNDDYACPKDDQLAFHYFKLAADQGHLNSTYEVGKCFSDGIGVIKNGEQAFLCFRKGYERNHLDCLNAVAVCYESGEGTPKNLQLALWLWRQGANRGHAVCMYNLGRNYYGRGVKENNQEAFRRFKQSADRGYAPAQYYLGMCYDRGHGANVNQEKAIYYNKLAADQGYSDAVFHILFNTVDLLREPDLIKNNFLPVN